MSVAVHDSDSDHAANETGAANDTGAANETGTARESETGAESDTRPAHVAPHDIPEPAVTRLATYLHVLTTLRNRGVLVASSGQLATAAGVNPAILRKDLSYVGANGVRGVGYDVHRLTARIALALHTDSTHTVALAGAGRLGRTLLAHAGFGRGFRVAVMFDADPGLIGTSVEPGGPLIAPISSIVEVCTGPDAALIEIGVIATADSDAQDAADAFVAAGVRQLLNVTPATLSTDSDVVVRQVDLALELQVLAFNASRSRVPTASAARGTGMRATKREPASGPAGAAVGEETVTA